jgi:hypothetical protein
MNKKDLGVKIVNEGHTVVRIAGEGEEQSPLVDRGEPLNYLFAPGIRQEHRHRMCRTSQTSAHASRFSLTLFPYLDASFKAARVTAV